MALPRSAAAARGGVRRLLLALAIVLAGALAYEPSLPGEFIWDDDAHVTENAVLRDPQALQKIWVPAFEPRYAPHTPQYYPLAFSALWLEFKAFGLDPLGYHVVNLALHLANALLAWAVFARLKMRGAWLVGALFALHPMHVETTAWVMEIKNLLSGFFYLLAALAYLRFDERYARGRGAPFPAGAYALTALLFLCALLSKSVTCTLPAALVLALLFRRERIDARRLAPLVPLLVLGIALALNTAWLERAHVGAEGVEFDFSLAERVLIASRVLLFYPFKLLAPWPHLFVYPRWEIEPASVLAWWPLFVVALIAAAAVGAYARGRRGPPLALAFFAGSIFPALGLIPFYPMLFSFVADHFVYLPSLGILALAAAAIERGLCDARLRSAVAAAALLALCALTRAQSAHFATAEALYRHTLAHNPDAWLARTQLAQLLLPGGQRWKGVSEGAVDAAKVREAEELLRGAIELYPDHAMPHYNLALALHHQGRDEEAAPHAQRAAEVFIDDPEANWVAGMLTLRAGAAQDAERFTARALELDPRSFKAQHLLAECRLAQGRIDEAREPALRALELAPSEATRASAARLLIATLGRLAPADALSMLESLAARGGALPLELDAVRAQALASLGRVDEALRLTQELLGRAGEGPSAEPLRRQLEALRRQVKSSREGGEAQRR